MPGKVTLVPIGNTWEGRQLKVLKISTGTPKKAFWLDGGKGFSGTTKSIRIFDHHNLRLRRSLKYSISACEYFQELLPWILVDNFCLLFYFSLSGTHAREWISPAVVTFIVNELVNNYQKHKTLVDSFEWHILPVLNADGYEFSRQSLNMVDMCLNSHETQLRIVWFAGRRLLKYFKIM